MPRKLYLAPHFLPDELKAHYRASQDPVESRRWHLLWLVCETSSGQDDSGLFELNFRDERYLPFEGSGAISHWQLEMPNEFCQFDYNTISDVILHINFMAREGGRQLGNAANQHLREGINAIVTGDNAPDLHQAFSTAHQFPTELHRFLHPADGAEQQTLTLNLAKNTFP